MVKLSSCLWFDGKAEEAVKFYRSVFKNTKLGNTSRYSEASAKVSGQTKGSVMMVELTIEDQKVLALNGGPLFKFTPAISYTVWCETEAEIDQLWKSLSSGGNVRMALDTYPWSKKYGWTADKFGVDWQLILAPNKQKITTSILFVDKLFGRGEDAIKFYTSIFKGSELLSMTKDEATKSVVHGHFKLGDKEFVLMEGQGTHNYTFSEAFSIVIECANQQEIDHYYAKLSEGGSQDPCGWVKDKFGVSWQVTPDLMSEVMADPSKAEKAMEVLLTMHKPDLNAIKKAIGQH